MSYTALGIIPARGGSKGLPRKNIRHLAGKPLIAHTIEAARQSRRLTRFLVSTDDAEIRQVAESCGAPVLMRPPELAADSTPMLPVLQHVVATLKASQGVQFDYVIILQPTSPLRNAADIDGALEALSQPDTDSVVSVYLTTHHHPSKLYKIQDGLLCPLAPDPPVRLRQKLEPIYHRNGAIFAFQTRLMEEKGLILGSQLRPFIMPQERSVDIDDEFDLQYAEFLLGRRPS